MMEILIGCMGLLYALTLVLELARPVLHANTRGLALGMVLAGFLVHTAILGYHTVVFWEQIQGAGAFWAVKRDWYFALAWGLTAVCLAWMMFRPGFPFAALFLPLVLILLGVGFFLAEPVPFERNAASQVWGFVHALSLMGATLCIFVAIIAGGVYLWQGHRVKKGLVTVTPIRPPSLEWLQKANAHAVLAAIGCLAVGILSGIVLNAVAGESGDAALPWNDPLVVSTFAMFAWLAGTVLIGAFYRPLREGRKVAYFTFLSFVFLVLALALMLAGWTQHGQKRGATTGGPGTSAVPILQGVPLTQTDCQTKDPGPAKWPTPTENVRLAKNLRSAESLRSAKNLRWARDSSLSTGRRPTKGASPSKEPRPQKGLSPFRDNWEPALRKSGRIFADIWAGGESKGGKLVGPVFGVRWGGDLASNKAAGVIISPMMRLA